MIDKRIIYCWFGGKEKPETVKNCIKTWVENMPNWEILEINENNFDINYNQYVKDAHEKRHWAYVSDVARLWALYNFGGIYMDTDVIVYKTLEPFLKHECFTGFESKDYPVTSVIGATKGNELIKELLDKYETEKFETHDNWWEYRTNTIIMSEVIRKYIECNNEFQENKIAVYPRKVFCYNDDKDGTEYTEHLMLGNWKDLIYYETKNN